MFLPHKLKDIVAEKTKQNKTKNTQMTAQEMFMVLEIVHNN